MSPRRDSAWWAGFGLGGCFGLLAISLASHVLGCGDSRGPGTAAASSFTQVGAQVLPGDAATIERELAAWVSSGYPAISGLTFELRHPHPSSVPPAVIGGDPFVVLGGTSVGVCGTYPNRSILCARGGEWAIVHELLHVLHQVEGRAPETHVNPLLEDPRWVGVNKLRDQRRAELARLP